MSIWTRHTFTVECRVNGEVVATQRYGMGSNPSDAESYMKDWDARDIIKTAAALNAEDLVTFLCVEDTVREHYGDEAIEIRFYDSSTHLWDVVYADGFCQIYRSWNEAEAVTEANLAQARASL